MSDPETPRRKESIMGVILEAADKHRQRDADLETALAAAHRLEKKATLGAKRDRKLAEEAIQRSQEDEPTGCFNRRYFEKFAQERFDPINDDGNVGLVFVDIDNLKKTNDTFGHAAGDRQIQSMAELLKTGVRKSGDTVVRLGGDEFVIISRPGPPTRWHRLNS